MNSPSNVTVIIPCYNDGQYILQALQSIYDQTLLPEKIIIVDDGSGFETKEILATIKNPLVTIICQENQGVCKARNTAIRLSNTKYILNLDADDFFENSFILKAVDILHTQPKVGVVGCFYKSLRGVKIDSVIIKPVGGTASNFLVKNNGAPSSMFRKQCWEEVAGYDEKMVHGYEDWEFWFSIVKYKWEMFIIDEVLFTYRIKKSSRDKTALSDFDLDLRMYIFSKHQDIYKQHFVYYVSEMLRQNSILRNNVNKVKEGVDNKVGRIMITPLRFLKKIIFK